MRLSFPLPERFDTRALLAHLRALDLDGLTGASLDGERVHLELPEREALTPEEEAAAAAAVAAYAFAPTWDAVRRQRVPLLLEADWRIARAEDAGEATSALRAYRQALRDVTLGPDPESPTWPTPPWAEGS